MQTLLSIVSGVALLVWSTHIVRSGVLRVFGGNLRKVLAESVSNRFHAFLTGLGVTALVQSSSATAVIASSFVGQNLMGLALANATREALRIGDIVENMLGGVLGAIRANDGKLAREVKRMDDLVDDLYTSVKLYLTQISREALDERESRRWAEIMSFTINLEHVGDIVEHIVDDLEEKKISKGRSFSRAGMKEIEELHARLMTTLRLALNVFLNGDLKSAQMLIAQKAEFRALERAYAGTLLDRLAWQTPESIETSSLHLDIINDFKRINSHFCAVAYPILEGAGVPVRAHPHEQVVTGAERANGTQARNA